MVKGKTKTNRSYDPELLQKLIATYKQLTHLQKSAWKAKFDNKFGKRRWESIFGGKCTLEHQEVEFLRKNMFSKKYTLQEIELADAVRVETNYCFSTEEKQVSITLFKEMGFYQI